MGGYIGSSVGNLANAAERKQTYSITTSTTSLTGLAYTPTKVHVFHNGVRLVDGTDYTATNGTSITLTNAAQNGDEVVVISYPSFQTSDTVSAANGGTFAGNVAMSGTLGVTGATTLSDDLVVDTDTLFADASANRVGIGTASPSAPLDVTKAGGGNFVAVFQNTTDATPYGIHVKDAASGANGYPLFQVTNNAGSTTYFRVNSGNGYVVSKGIYDQSAADSANVVVDSAGNVYRSTSALKYKQNVRDIESIDIDRFRPVRYKSNLEKDDNTKDHFGFIADEVHDDGLTELVAYGLNPDTDELEVEGFRYDRMTVILTKVVQEQKATIEEQATQIADLITRVSALEGS